MKELYGWKGRIVQIDLSTKEIKTFIPEHELFKEFLGGRGLGAKLVYDNGHIEDALSPENILVFATGPLTGTRAPSSGRLSLSTKSPLTGTILDCNCGGFLGVELKKAGYDAVIIRGKSPEPVFIEIENERVELKSASGIWGKNTKETTRLLKSRGRGRVACIGRAGEKQVLLAAIISDGVHAFGRGGAGAVMGSKNLKALVVKGSGDVDIHDRAEFERQRQAIKRLLIATPTISKGLSVFGTAFLMKITSWMKVLPVANFSRSEPEFKLDTLFASEINRRYNPGKRACHSCSIACKREDDRGRELPEYETIGLMSANIGNSSYEAIVEANMLCNDYGIDTISVAGVLGCYGDIKGKRINDTELLDMVRAIGECEGIGAQLGQGVKRYSSSEGYPERAMQVKGLQLPAYDPRVVKGLGFSYATSNRGGCHTRAYLVAPEILRKPKAIDPYTLAGKAGHTKIFQDRFAAVDSLIVCKFAFFGAGEEEYANILSAVTGVEYTSEDLMRVGERIWNIERLYNIREGFTRADDTLPARFFDEAVNGHVIEHEEFQNTLDEYYRMRGWDENGVPTKRVLEKLNLGVYI